MDIQRAKELLTVLSDGINPITGEVLPNSDSCNQADIVRALHAVLMELDKSAKKEPKTQCKNAGAPWSAEEDEKLLCAYRNGTKAVELAKIHGRTKGAIAARLVKLGEIRVKKDAK